MGETRFPPWTPLVGFHSRRAGLAGPSAFTGRISSCGCDTESLSSHGLAATSAFCREPVLTWGRHPPRLRDGCPGTSCSQAADGVATRAVEIAAPASAVWPWIAQMGPAPRGGAYTYDWIENLLGLDMHSVDRVLPESGPGGGRARSATGRTGCGRLVVARAGARVAIRGRQLGLGVRPRRSRRRHEADQPQPLRLPTLGARLAMLLMEPASLVMERKMLRGI